MILRLAASAAVHATGGVIFGVTAALAACTLTQAARHMAGRPASPQATDGSATPPPPPPDVDPAA